jgi:magnesium chelatase family protein
MNPCPCGYLGHPEKSCRCAASAIERYHARLSGPFLDRIDVLVEVPPLTIAALESEGGGDSSATFQDRVLAALAFREGRSTRTESAASQSIEGRNHLTSEARALLRQALIRHSLSGRAYVRVIGLARTIADLDNVMPVGAEHVAEALALRLDHRRVQFA